MVNLIKVENLLAQTSTRARVLTFGDAVSSAPNKQEVSAVGCQEQRTLNPSFSRCSNWRILANDVKNQVLVFRILDHDRFSKNDLMGTVIMPLRTRICMSADEETLLTRERLHEAILGGRSPLFPDVVLMKKGKKGG
ncbi:hypothetical protein GBAR_LOCUS30756 [Geodia barretti]|uniref:C2 domain-containing protein n=1 Tax=Geodia barretti TaxID=519541 RepID=A0AA35TZG3_GEOBA|nr:hypothetical protein GBAR_LOCUS30756 [Geodia barretti]